MKFNTPLLLSQPEHKISIKDKILTIGSCFSDSIGNKLIENKFDTLANPFGTIFDPLSISRVLSYSLNNQSPSPQSYVFSQGVYKNLEVHSSFTGLSPDELTLKIKARLTSTHDFLTDAEWIIITFGTAFVYQHKESKTNIANCQKLPSLDFTKHLADKDELQSDFQNLLDLLKKFNPDIKIVLTVSPVRHIADGLEENSISKAILRQLCNDLAVRNRDVTYYPAYEIMMDDLRDYRFYKEDMIHPTDQAIDYIWQHFSSSFMDKSATEFMNKWSKIRRSLEHRPFNPTTEEHQTFLRNTLKELEGLSNKVDLRKEIEQINKQITNN
ncbi:MAG: hypothetical protein DRI71_02100 [Bacteroidetes bacterium]|nr:MAG: hypothetical protein DRI71_02100 [Bacteroidota bacterium]